MYMLIKKILKPRNIEDIITGGMMAMFLAIFIAFPQLSAVLAVLNESFDGWILHFYTVAFVEYLEMFGILIYFRYFIIKNASISLKFTKS